jgi:hypothetical protein
MTILTSRMLIFGVLISGMLHGLAFADTEAADQAILLPDEARATGMPSLFGSAAINNDALEASRGGAEVQVLNKNALDGVVSHNDASNLTTGSNLVAAGSFDGASGFSTIIQNSGNNVLIQNSTIVNVQLK